MEFNFCVKTRCKSQSATIVGTTREKEEKVEEKREEEEMRIESDRERSLNSIIQVEESVALYDLIG